MYVGVTRPFGCYHVFHARPMQNCIKRYTNFIQSTPVKHRVFFVNVPPSIARSAMDTPCCNKGKYVKLNRKVDAFSAFKGGCLREEDRCEHSFGTASVQLRYSSSRALEARSVSQLAKAIPGPFERTRLFRKNRATDVSHSENAPFPRELESGCTGTCPRQRWPVIGGQRANKQGPPLRVKTCTMSTRRDSHTITHQ